MGVTVKITDRDRGWKAMFKAVQSLRGKRYAKVGVLSGTEKGDAAYKEGGLTVAEIAAVMEYGTKDGRVPERSFLRSTFEEQRDELIKKSGEYLVEIMCGNMGADQALNRLGAQLADATKKKITSGEGIPPPLKPSTIARKGSDRPLVDTGRLIGAITWTIASGESEE